MKHSMAVRTDKRKIAFKRSLVACDLTHRDTMVSLHEAMAHRAVGRGEVKAANLTFKLACLKQPLFFESARELAVALQASMPREDLGTLWKG